MECPMQPPARNVESLGARKIVWRNQIYNFPQPLTTSTSSLSSMQDEQDRIINISPSTEQLTREIEVTDINQDNEITDSAINPSTAATIGRKRRSTGMKLFIHCMIACTNL